MAESVFITYSPELNIAGILSPLGPPGPNIGPPIALFSLTFVRLLITVSIVPSRFDKLIGSPASLDCSSNNACIVRSSSTTGSATAARIFIISNVGDSFNAAIRFSLISSAPSPRAPALSSRVIPLYCISPPSRILLNSSLYSPKPIPFPRIFFHTLLKLKKASCNSSSLASFGAT